MPATQRKRLRLSPLFVRFAEPEANTTGPRASLMRHYIRSFTSEDDDGSVTAYHLHATKGWRKHRVSGPQRDEDEMYQDEEDEG